MYVPGVAELKQRKLIKNMSKEKIYMKKWCNCIPIKTGKRRNFCLWNWQAYRKNKSWYYNSINGKGKEDVQKKMCHAKVDG